jgi:hypothetical protein
MSPMEGHDRLDPELAELEGEALLGEVRARIAESLRGLSGRAYEAALAPMPEPMRVVHALDLLAGSLASARGAIERRTIERGIEALVALGLHADAEAITSALDPESASVDSERVANLAELADDRADAWNDVLVAYVEERRTYVH